MLGRLLDRARELGYRCVHLDTTVGQTAARKLYCSAGFAETGRTKYAGFDVIRFEKAL